jgi:hypothetical protein
LEGVLVQFKNRLVGEMGRVGEEKVLMEKTVGLKRRGPIALEENSRRS